MECGPNGECPTGFECSTSGFCVQRGATGPDAGLDGGPGNVDTVIVVAPPAFAGTATAHIEFSSPTSVDATFVCSLDGADATPCASPFEQMVGEGPHTFTVAAELGGDRDGTPATASWIVDLTPPDTTVTGPSGTVSTSDATFEFMANEPATFECALDDEAFAACATPHPLSGLPPGEHVLLVRAVDRAENRDPQPAEARWTIDVSGPVVALDGVPAEGAVTASLTGHFTFTSEPGATFFCSLDNAAFDECTSPADVTVSGAGAHRFAVRAEDATGNEGPTVARSWTVDNVGPTTTLAGTPAQGAVVNTRNASFTFTAEAGARFRCSVDGAAFGPCTSPQSFTTPAMEGDHSFAVRALDTLDNQGPTVTRTWRLDLTPPTVNLSGTPGDGDTTNQRNVSFTFTSEAGARFECSRDGVTPSSCTSPQNYTVTGADGQHSFAVVAIDTAGNPSAPSTIIWTLVTTGPTTTLGGTPAEGATTNQAVNFTFTSAGVRFECARDTAAFSSCTSPQSYSLATGGSADGQHTFNVRAFDAVGNPGPVATRTFNWDTVGPAIATLTGGPSEGGLTNNPGFVYSFTAAEAGATFQCQWDSLGVHACPGQDQAPWSANPHEGDHTFTVRAFDALNNPGPMTVRHFHLDAISPSAVIDTRPADACPGTGPRVGVQVIGTTVTFTFHTDDPTATLLCQLDGALPLQPCTSPKVYSNLSLASHTFFIRALDPAGNITNPSPGQGWTNVSTCP